MANESGNLRKYINILENMLLEAKKDSNADLFPSDIFKDEKPTKEKSKKTDDKVDDNPKSTVKDKPSDEPNEKPVVKKIEKKPATSIDDLMVNPADPEKIVSTIHYRIWNKAVPIPKNMHRSFRNAVGKLSDRNPELSKDESEALLLVLQRIQDKLQTEF